MSEYPNRIRPENLGMSATKISITCSTFGLDDNIMDTDSISPITYNFFLSNWTICTKDFWGVMFKFVHNVLGIMFEEAPE